MEKKTTKINKPTKVLVENINQSEEQEKTPKSDSLIPKIITKDTIKELTLAKGRYIHTIGRRKSSVATIHLFNEQGNITVNEKTVNDYFTYKADASLITEPLKLVNAIGKYKITIKVNGGGKKGQADAIRLGIARALIKLDPELRKTLKSNGLLTRDPRVKERKKPGLKRARKAPQWAKR